ncbi:daxx-like protein [Anopheles maculipalpis]|uniref:daxx-like protein n=1 Tax=Anopheles maculipalpis TaxID=1496333 RepID=UPI002158BA1F|nr:daxx-like protein [Anopheles maculipalpis]
MATSASVIVLDSDTDDDGVVIESPSNRRGSKRKGSPSPPNTSHTEIQQNGTSGSSNSNTRTSVSGGGGAHDPQRKRIKPITITTDLSDKRWSSDGTTPPHNNNNNHTITGNENFAPITYSEDWEQEIKQYQLKLAAGGEKQNRTLPAATATVTSCRSSNTTTTNDDSDPNNSSNRGTPGSVDKSSAETQPTTKEQRKVVGRNTTKGTTAIEKNAIGKEFQELLDACRKADSSDDMERLINRKLIRYYEIVHPDYVKSKSFKKAVAAATAGIRAQPHLVFLKLVNIVEELKARKKSRSVAPPTVELEVEQDNNPATTCGRPSLAEEDFSTGNSKKDQQIRQLNYALYVLNKRIRQMEEAEVDFNQETNSTYVQGERLKKHATKIYEKLCDITGESKHAHRLLREPINFQGSQYREFNHTLSQFINRTNIFPNFREVLRCLEYCNTRHGYGLRSERMNRIAHDAFIKVGKQLQKRRKTDLYETVMYHTGDEKDPATIDPKLREKLEENGKHYSKVNSIIDKYAEKELCKREELQDKKEKSATSVKQSNETKPSSSKEGSATATSTDTGPNGGTHDAVLQLSDDDDEDDDDETDDEDEEEDDAESTTKENVRPDSFEDIIISDDDELIILDS